MSDKLTDVGRAALYSPAHQRKVERDRQTGYATENVALLTQDERDTLDDMIAKVRRNLTTQPESGGVFVADGDAWTDTSSTDA